MSYSSITVCAIAIKFDNSAGSSYFLFSAASISVALVNKRFVAS